MKGVMNLTEDKVKLVGYTFAISLLIPPNVGLNILGLNFEDLPLVVLFSYLFYLKIDDYKKNSIDKFDTYFLLFLSVFIVYTNIFVENKEIFNQTNLRFYFYFFLAYLVISIYEINKNKIINLFEPLSTTGIPDMLFFSFIRIAVFKELSG